MARNRLNSQSAALFVGPSPAETTPQLATAIAGIANLQSVDWDFDIPTENITTLGNIAATVQQQGQPTVNLNFSYYNVDLYNEFVLGFDFNDNSNVSSILKAVNDERNYYIGITAEGINAAGSAPADMAVYSFGNGFISSFSVEAAVGGYPTTTVGVEALNLTAEPDGVNQPIPTVNPVNGARVAGVFTLPNGYENFQGQSLVLQQGDLTLNIPNDSHPFETFSGTDGVCIQSFNISFDLSREDIECLGSRFAKTKTIETPVEVTFSVDALAGDLKSGDLADLLCNYNAVGYDVQAVLNQPTCTGDGALAAQYTLKNAKLQSSNFSLSANDNATISTTWVGTISASGDTTNGLFWTGITGYNAGTPLYS